MFWEGVYIIIICIIVIVILDDMEVFSFIFRCGMSCCFFEFYCGNGICIFEEWVCDRDSNCVDGIDEFDSFCGNIFNSILCI